MIEATLGALIWTFILQHVAALAQSVAQNVGAEEFKALLSTFTLQRKVQNAASRAVVAFQKSLARADGDPKLASALDHGAFYHSPEVAKVLAQAALNPPERSAQIAQLADIIGQFAPGFAGPRRESASRSLIELTHKEISGIKQLREGLLLLETQRVRERQDRPEYTPGLYPRITYEARTIADRLGHHQIATGHLLYAILAQPHSVATWALGALQVTADKVRPALAIINAQTAVPPGTIGPGATKALQRARDLARECGALETGTEHVLLAIAALALEAHEGRTTRGIFARIGVDPQAVYAAAASAAHAQGVFQSAVVSFCGADEASSAQTDNDLPIDARETLRNFGV